jgi:two-component system, sporulation sensor kinase E
MRNFIRRALEKFPKLDKSQIFKLLNDMAVENERLESVIESMQEGLVVCDRQHVVILGNKTARRLLGVSGNDFLEQVIWETVTDPEIAEFLKKRITEEEKVKDEEFAIGSSGAQKILNLNILPLVAAGRVEGTLVRVEDVTEKKRGEARLRRAESLAALTTLTAGVAHEIKNPLGSMSIHIQLIQKTLQNGGMDGGDKGPAEIKEHLNIVEEEINRLNSIVVDFLFAVRPMDTTMEERNINPILEEIIELVSVELENAGIEVRCELGEELPNILLDEKYLKQAILNLIKNSISAMTEGGCLTLRSRRKNEHIEITVEDTGVGIPEKIMEKIFEPYFTTKDFGSGLGLTVVYKIVKEHLGDITVDSREGRGTAFILSFPIPQKERRLIGWKGDAHEV